MTFCVQCGNPLTEGAAFCSSCGARVASDSAPAATKAPTEDAPTQMARAVSSPGTRLPGSNAPAANGDSPAGFTDQGAPNEPAPTERAPLGATAYPAPPSDDATRITSTDAPVTPSRLGAQYDWAQASSNQSDDADTTQQAHTSAQPHTSTEPAVTQGHDASGQAAQAPDGPQPPLGQQFSQGSASAPQSGYPSAPHTSTGHQTDAPDAYTSAAPSTQGEPWGQQEQTSASAQPPMTQPIARPSHDSTQQMPQRFGGQPVQNQQPHAGQQPYAGDQYVGQQFQSEPYGAPQSYGSQPYDGQPFESQPSQGQPYDAQLHPGQRYPSAPQRGYAQQAPAGHSSAPHLSNTPQNAQQNGMGGAPQGVAQMQRPTLDWKALTPGLLRLLAAVTLALTALGNWWTSDEGTSADQVSTIHSVFGLIGCIGVVLACVTQVAVLPQFLGAAMQPIVRLAVRAVLCLPALIAVIIAIVTTLGGPDSTKASYVGVTMLAMAIGFALAGMDDARTALPADVLRWVTVGFSGLGIVLTVVTLIQSLGTDQLSGKGKWLGVVPSDLGIIAAAGVIIWICLARPTFGRGLLVALAGSVALSLVTRGWIADGRGLAFVSFFRQGHGAGVIALALALATVVEVSGDAHDTATDDGSVARRLTQWVVPGFAVAAVAALITAFFLISGRDDSTPGGMTWYLVLMFITALIYGACAFLLRTHAMGRIVAVASAVTLSITILITLAAAKGSGTVSEAFSEGAYLWLPLVAAAALTIPPAVRRVAGPILPQTRGAAGQGEAQQPGAQGEFGRRDFGQGEFAHSPQAAPAMQGQRFSNQPFQSEPFEGQPEQAPQQWNDQPGAFDGRSN